MDQEYQLINPKDNNVSPEERHKLRMPELPPVPKGNNRYILVSVQELVYGSKETGVGTSSKSFDRKNDFIYSGDEIHGPSKYGGPSEGLGTHVLQRTSPKDKSLVEKKPFCQRTRRRSWPKEKTTALWKLLKPPQEIIFLKKRQTRTSKPQRAIRRARKRKRERQNPSLTGLIHRATEFQRKKDSHGQCVQYGKNSYVIQKQG
ncbi:hypothetical protein O181_118967 [Austropuccinia psidii MF-1]|uniref:Uncharacterized protein n=1 Tax=Austropuccinia psidii MF-1 TaxID=1389203 RepID=A0A9Q3KE64_9BASI|nr:hypothetical protein [Austropuccinia psidii MF-1]